MPTPRRTLAAVALLLALAGCQPGQNPRPVPSVAQIGGDLKCANGDHAFEDLQAGWGFCYPGTWKYNERSQGSQNPPGLDLTFDITCLTRCRESEPSDPACTGLPPGATPPSQCTAHVGLFGFMILSTYERGGATDVASWLQANFKPVPKEQPISWGDSVQAAQLDDGRRIALTQHHVVIMVLHSGAGLLDLESEMSARLDTWRFTF
ncbi:MAG TPA: hypothetical protein VGG31_01900 [Candidatus Dormibacteraeota bacterium]|jgi:hypothetical protein